MPLALASGYAVWQCQELRKFTVTHYELPMEGLGREVRLAVLADLHGFSYGKHNSRLAEAVRGARPDAVLIAGDMVTSREAWTFARALDTLGQLVEIAPVYYAMGNHETRCEISRFTSSAFRKYCRDATALGVTFLRNKNIRLSVEDGLWLAGLEAPLAFFEKGGKKALPMRLLADLLGPPHREGIQLLLAHNPAYGEQYAKWGADLTICGHNHGGLVRIPGLGGVVSPQFELFPKYGEGMHEIGGRHLITSRGLGTHTFHIRIRNRAELVIVRLLPAASS